METNRNSRRTIRGNYSNKRERINSNRSRRGSNFNSRKRSESSDIREKILLQCIISGMILFVALILNFVKTDFTVNMKSSLRMALSTETSREDLINQATKINDMVDSMRNSVQGVFITENDDFRHIELQNEQHISEEMDFRIDEDILGRIDDNEKKWQSLDGKY